MNLENHIVQHEEIALHSQKEVKKSVKFLGRLRLHKGQQLFELNTTSKMITPVTITDSATDLKGNVRRKFVIKEGCLYAPAINVKNAEKKFLKMFK